MYTMKKIMRSIYYFLLIFCMMVHSAGHAEIYYESELASLSDAIVTYKSTLQKNSHNTETLFQLANTYLKIGKIDEALSLYETINTMHPHSVSALYNIGYTLKTAGRIDEAIVVYQNVLSAAPSYDPAHLALGFAYLNKGDFVQGWKQHERYLKKSNKNADALRELLRNENLLNKRILCTYEGGIGDTLMFIRYVATLKELGAYTLCRVQKSLIPLLSRCPYIDELYTLESKQPIHDASSTLMSLPAVFNSTEEMIPQNIPYLFPDPTLIADWQQKLADVPGIKIGLCWQADRYNDSSRLPIARRGIPLDCLFPLLSNPQLHFYSLQCFDGTEQIKTMPSNCRLHVFDDFDTSHGSFMDTAALITQLDLIISVDTAVAHLAGALGKPVILLLPYAVDWRWIYGRVDSPWYPTMTLLKQPKPFDWKTVVENLYTHLRGRYPIIV
jgi:tetratricopeptide repeat protein/glycosyl transferase family 9 (putative heptosyltransferase)